MLLGGQKSWISYLLGINLFISLSTWSTIQQCDQLLWISAGTGSLLLSHIIIAFQTGQQRRILSLQLLTLHYLLGEKKVIPLSTFIISHYSKCSLSQKIYKDQILPSGCLQLSGQSVKLLLSNRVTSQYFFVLHLCSILRIRI